MRVNLTLAGAAFEAEGEPAEVQAFYATWLATVQSVIARATAPAPQATQREMH